MSHGEAGYSPRPYDQRVRGRSEPQAFAAGKEDRALTNPYPGVAASVPDSDNGLTVSGA